MDKLELRVTTLEKFVEDHRKHHVELTQQHKELMEEIHPITEALRNANGFRRVSIGILKVIVLLGAAVGVVWGAIKYLKT